MTDNEIVKALECCGKNPPSCADCGYKGKCNRRDCYDYLKFDALDLINRQKAEKEELQELIDEMSDYFPACVGCEGKTLLGERTDKCVYLLGNTNYCTKRGITNIVAIRNENHELKAQIEKNENIIRLADKTIETANAEIEELKRNYKALKYQENLSNRHCKNICEPKYKAEIKRLKYLLEREEKATLSLSKQCYKDGVKEFAEEYKAQIKNYTGMFTDDGFMVNLEAVLSAVDFIKNKLVGESNV